MPLARIKREFLRECAEICPLAVRPVNYGEGSGDFLKPEQGKVCLVLFGIRCVSVVITAYCKIGWNWF